MRPCVRVVCAVPVSVRGPPPQRYARAKCAAPHRARPAPQSQDCVRGRSLPGQAHFASLRSARPLAGTSLRSCARLLRNLRGSPPKASLSSAHRGGGGPRGWHGRAGASARRSLRHRLPVRRRVRASSAHERHPARSEYLPSPPAAPVRRCAHPAARARSGPVPAARPLARYRHMSVSAARVPRASL